MADEKAKVEQPLTIERIDYLLENPVLNMSEYFQALTLARGALIQRGAEYPAVESLESELRKHQDLVEALQWLPVGTVVDFYDLDDFLDEVRELGWKSRRECSHKFIDSDNCVHCGIDVDDLPAPPPETKP